jgi:hypothetical protein
MVCTRDAGKEKIQSWWVVNLKKNRWLTIALLTVLTISLSGCLDATIHLSVNDDGSGDLNYKMLIDPAALAFMQDPSGNEPDPFSEMQADLKKSGFAIVNLKEDGYVGFEAKKNIDNIQESTRQGKLFSDSNMDKNIKPGEGLTIDKRFFKTVYTLKMNFDMTDMADTGGSSEVDAMSQSMLNSMNFDFILTLPAKATTHNASTIKDEGATLVWNLMPGQTNEVTMTAAVWNVTNIVLLGAGTVILFGGLIAASLKHKSHSNGNKEDTVI